MRIQRDQTIAGLPASVARAIVRRFNSPSVTEVAEPFVGDIEMNANDAAARLAEAGYLKMHHRDNHGYTWWIATLEGNALAMASLGKPITRRTAERLLEGVVERAHTYNADPTRIRYVERLRVFGSYLNPDVLELGDLDVEIVVGQRDDSTSAALAYADASGRNFNTFIDHLYWADVELIRYLKNRSAAINITQEDVSELTDNVQTVYSIADDKSAIPPEAPSN